jgi:hypothetical protein
MMEASVGGIDVGGRKSIVWVNVILSKPSLDQS